MSSTLNIIPPCRDVTILILAVDPSDKFFVLTHHRRLTC